jgi:preprotein translocase SecE subunit
LVEHRSPKPGVGGSIPLTPARLNLLVMIQSFRKYISDVIIEARKISWLSKKDTLTTTVSVFIIVSIFACFFLLIDLFISNFINYILNI